MLADLDPGLLGAAAEKLAAGGAKVAVMAGDLSQQEVAGRTINAAIEHHGKLDILVNNARGGVLRPFLQHTP